MRGNESGISHQFRNYTKKINLKVHETLDEKNALCTEWR
jgi:hypothetical protein